MPPGGVPLTDAPGAPRRGRGRLAAVVVGLCLLSGVIGGVAGQLAQDRIHLAGTTLPEPGPGATQRPAGSVANIAAVALPSIVTIKVDAGSEGSATGSGFVIDGKGHVLTNNHVVEPGVNGDIEIVLSNGDTEKATIVGRDASYDLAVLKIQRTDLTPLQLGPSDKVVVGDQVIAIGAPLGLDQTVTTGIVSALNRPVTPGEGPRGLLHQRHPDRRRDQPRQLRRPAARHVGQGHRRQQRHRPRPRHDRLHRGQHRPRLRHPERPGAAHRRPAHRDRQGHAPGDRRQARPHVLR